MAHHDDIILSNRVRFGSSSERTWNTQVLFTASGFRQTNSRWSTHLVKLNLQYVRAVRDIAELAEIYAVVNGPKDSFLARDWADWNTRPDNEMRPGAESGVTHLDAPLINPNTGDNLADGTTTTFNLVKRYQAGATVYDRRIRKPEVATVRVGVDGADISGVSPEDYTVSLAGGTVTFSSPPPFGGSPTAVALTWGGAFHLPVAFTEDDEPGPEGA